MPVDVSADAIERALPGLVADYPGLEVHGVVADFERHLRPAARPTAPGWSPSSAARSATSSPAQRAAFLAAVGDTLGPVTRCCSAPTWSRTRHGWCARTTTRPASRPTFNRNVLHVINRELGADFDVDALRARRGLGRRAGVDRDAAAVASRDQTVDVPALDLRVDFAAGEEMRTEISAKFREDEVAAELTAAGLRLAQWWTDEPGDFALLALA